VAGRRKTVDGADALRRQFTKHLAQTGAFAADERDIVRADLTQIKNKGF
jgi:hypothetical protein